MSNIYLPIIKPASLGIAATATIDFSAIGQMGAVTMRNAGAGEIFVSFDAVPPSAAVQDGVIRLQLNESFSVENMIFTTIGLRTGGTAAVIETTAWQRPGGAGGSGFGG